uniref:Leucine rich immune protein (TM) n=1 Tax=Anopheles farauti TaxID=69004 RepID=A0A182Q5R6_9DIPT
MSDVQQLHFATSVFLLLTNRCRDELFKMRAFVGVFCLLFTACHGLIYPCEHYNSNDEYNVRHCTLIGVTVVHDAQDLDFTSEYPRPYWFEFRESRLNEIPRALFTTFPEMQTIDFRETHIENINKFTFENAKHLRQLLLSHNVLTVLGNFIFKGCDRLEWLDLSHNLLAEVKEKAFSDIRSLVRLDLNNNQLETLPEDTFTDLSSLQQLFLHENRLTVLAELLFKPCSLHTINLNDNRLQNFTLEDERQTWRVVHLRRNALSQVKLPNTVSEIDLSWNNLTEIEIDSKMLIQRLDLSHNLLTSVANFSVLYKLETLDVSFNPLGTVPLTTFLNMRRLSTLNLEATNLTSLEHGLFSQLQNLTWLDLSYNQLQTLDLTVLTPAIGLEHLHIDGNNLSSVEYDRLPALFPALSYLGLFDNTWNCSYLINVVQFCRQHSIKVSPVKSYGTTLNASNVEGIYCQSKPSSGRPPITPVEHPLGQAPSPTDTYTVAELLQMLKAMNHTTEQLMRDMSRSIHSASGPAVVTASCSALHAYNYQVFILLILSVILIINVGFLLWVQHNANVRRAVDQMIIFRREQGASIQTELHQEL